MKKSIFLFLSLALSFSANAEIRLPAQISENMVLQQQTKAKIWGWCNAGEKVSVSTSWNQEKYQAVADKSGRWIVGIDTPRGDFEEKQITISDTKSQICLNHVLIGEVWMASGQSNMEMPLKGFQNCAVEGYLSDLASAIDWKGRIRYATLPKTVAFEPLDSVPGSWKECVPANVGDFGAIGYYFAQNLTRNLQVPVGIINNAWGGSSVEGWLPKEALEEFGVTAEESQIKREYQASMHYPMVMNNGQFWPVKDYTIKGVIWYQGSTNASFEATSGEYAKRLARMVKHWREVKNQPDLPLYQGMLAPYGERSNPEGIAFPKLREQQMKAAEADSQIYLASLLDVYVPHEINQVHSRKKQIVGLRLSTMALANTYELKGFPKEVLKFSRYEIEDEKVLLKFDNWAQVGGWDRIDDIKGVEICGADLVWHPAVISADGYTEIMYASSPEVEQPVAVRYGWRNFSECTLAGANGLGAYPFRTDRILEGEIPTVPAPLPDGDLDGVWTGHLAVPQSQLDLDIEIVLTKISEGKWKCTFNGEEHQVKVHGESAKIANIVLKGHAVTGTIALLESGTATLNFVRLMGVPLVRKTNKRAF